MIVCHVCGTENPDGSKFCEGCGVELTAPVVAAVAEVVAAPLEAVIAPLETAPIAQAVAPVAEAMVAPVAEAVTPVAEVVAPVLEAAPVIEAALPELPELTPPPLPATDESALDLEAAPVVAAVVAPAVAVAPVAASVGSTLDGTINPKSTLETPINSAPKVARLIPRNVGNSTGYTMHSERMVVGRFDPSAGPVDIDLAGGQGENYISRRHAEVYLENGVWMVRDLGSTNGVYVKRAGQAQYSPRIIEPQALSDGDEVAFGNMKFLFVYSSDAA